MNKPARLVEAERELERLKREERGLLARGIGDEMLASERRKLDKDIQQKARAVNAASEQVERQTAIWEARVALPPADTGPQRGDGSAWSGTASPNFDQTPASGLTNRYALHAVARGQRRQESTYRPDRVREYSFLRDLYVGPKGDREAQERLYRNGQESADFYASQTGFEVRDMVNASTQGGDFVPPLYLADLWVAPSISRRPLADALPSLPLPPSGTSISIPQLSSGVSVAARSDGGSVSETDGVSATITHDVNEISGMVDVGRIAVMRSDPTLDAVIGQTLQRRLDAEFESQIITGNGTAPNHRRILNVSGVNAITFTAATPTSAQFISKVADGIQQIGTNRKGEFFADLVVLHPRRGAWAASSLSSTVPLFQLGALNQAAGQMQAGFVDNLLGLKVVMSAQIPTNLGSGTDEDRVILLAREDFILLEGPGVRTSVRLGRIGNRNDPVRRVSACGVPEQAVPRFGERHRWDRSREPELHVGPRISLGIGRARDTETAGPFSRFELCPVPLTFRVNSRPSPHPPMGACGRRRRARPGRYS